MLKIMFSAGLICALALMAAAQKGKDYHRMEVFGGYSYDIAKNVYGNTFEVEVPSNSSLSGTAGLGKDIPFQGFDSSFTYNFTKRWGVKFELSSHRTNYDEISLPAIQFTSPTQGTLTFNGINPKTKFSHYNYLGGIQYKNNGKEGRFKPFAHALVGMSTHKVEYEDLNKGYQIIYDKNSFSSTGLTYAVGGGIDIKVHRRFDVRVIQFDYMMSNLSKQTIITAGDSRTFPAGNYQNLQVLSTSGSFKSLATQTVVGNKFKTEKHFTFGFGIVFH